MTISEYNEKAQNFQFKYRTTNPLAIAKTESEKLEFIAQLEKDLIRLQYDYLRTPYQDINAEGFFSSAYRFINKAKNTETNDIRHQVKAISNAVKATIFQENTITKAFDFIVDITAWLNLVYFAIIEEEHHDRLRTDTIKKIKELNSIDYGLSKIESQEESVINEDFRIPLLVGQLRQLKEKIENEEEENKIEYSFVKILVLARKIEDSLKRRIQND